VYEVQLSGSSNQKVPTNCDSQQIKDSQKQRVLAKIEFDIRESQQTDSFERRHLNELRVLMKE